MSDTPLSNHVAKTYAATRRGLGFIAIIFPLLLLIGGYFLARLQLEGSMSAYYHSSPLSQADELLHPGTHILPGVGVMRNWFVGLLFALGIILFLYKGFTRMEDYALNIAGVMGLGVALFPMAWGNTFKGMEFTVLGIQLSLHGTCALALFLCIGYVCIFRAADTLDLIKDAKKRKHYRVAYKWLGWAMIASPLTAFLLSSVFHKHNAYTFFIELAGIWVFAAYWLLKSHEISKSDADGKAARGELRVVDDKKSHPFRKIQIQETPSAK
jgi:hypothetical protein